MRRFFRGLAAAFLAVPLICATAHAEDAIQVTDAFARAAPAGGAGGVFLTIVNNGPADRLTGVASPAATTVDLHETINDNGIMKMRPVAGIDIPAGGTAKLSPGGYHVMMTGLKQALSVGGQVPVTLRFQKAGPIDVIANVVKPGAGAPMQHDMSHMPGMGNMPGMAPGK